MEEEKKIVHLELEEQEAAFTTLAMTGYLILGGASALGVEQSLEDFIDEVVTASDIIAKVCETIDAEPSEEFKAVLARVKGLREEFKNDSDI